MDNPGTTYSCNLWDKAVGWSFLFVSLAPWEGKGEFPPQGGKENSGIMTPEPATDFRLQYTGVGPYTQAVNLLKTGS